MSSNTQHILLNLESAPPPGVWENISARLNTEFDATEIKIAHKLYDWETAPPPGAWDHIAIALSVESASPKAPSKLIRLPFRKVAIAAIILGIVSVVTWNFLSSPASDPIVQGDQTTPPGPSNNTTGNEDDITVQPSMPAIDASIGIRRRTTFNIARRANRPLIMAVNYATGETPEEITSGIQHAGVTGLRAQSITSRNGIKAPPIKDAEGNIIMDYSLLTSGDNNYIIITCPNGEQTRISTKFLPMLNYLNAATEPAEYFDVIMRENSVWKNRFSEWRSKLMQQASFIPTATNFLDILELRDMLEEQ
jgi:hypothetical protein